METVIRVDKLVNIKSILIDVQPRYIGTDEDDDMKPDTPMLNGEQWTAKVDVDTGEIAHWPKGTKCEFYIKVCDAGTYTLYDDKAEQVAEIQGYVPNGIVPGEYGDYINLKIDENGFITNWPKTPDLSEFFEN